MGPTRGEAGVEDRARGGKPQVGASVRGGVGSGRCASEWVLEKLWRAGERDVAGGDVTAMGGRCAEGE